MMYYKTYPFRCHVIPPQLTNNNIRWHNVDISDANGYTVTPDYCGEYFTFNDACSCLMWGSQGWAAFQGDEINMRTIMTSLCACCLFRLEIGSSVSAIMPKDGVVWDKSILMGLSQGRLLI